MEFARVERCLFDHLWSTLLIRTKSAKISPMTRHIAFLYTENIGGQIVKMDELRAIFASLGLSRVETYIASGSVSFEEIAAGCQISSFC